MDTEVIKKQMAAHLQDLMLNAQLYGWERARTFHGVWLNQLEQVYCTWIDKEEKLKLHRALVWHPTSSSFSAPLTTRASGRTRQHSHKSPAEYNTPARPGTKACQAYNTIGCSGQQGEHPDQQHICYFCLLAINQAFPHTETECIRKGLST